MFEYDDRDQFGTVYRATGEGEAFNRHQTRINGGPIQTSSDGRTVNNDNSLQPTDEAEIYSVALIIEYDMGFATLSSLTGYKDHDYQYVEDFDALPTVTFNYGQDQSGEYFEQEFRLTSNSEGPPPLPKSMVRMPRTLTKSRKLSLLLPLIPGVKAIRSLMSLRLTARMSSPDMAVIASGTSITDSERLVAVTITSSSCCACEVWAETPATSAKETACAILVRLDAGSDHFCRHRLTSERSSSRYRYLQKAFRRCDRFQFRHDDG